MEGRPEPGPNEHIESSWDRVNPQFFETVGQPVIRGRGFTDADTATSQLVAVVNQAFVKKFFPEGRPDRAPLRHLRPEVRRRVRDCGHRGRRQVQQPARVKFGPCIFDR